MALTPEDKRYIDEAVATQIDIMAAFRDLPEASKEAIANDIGAYIYQRQRALRDPENTYTLRWTKGMADINYDNSVPTPLARGHAGPTLPRWIDIVGGSAYLDSQDSQILHIATGGGADCMFDYLVSSCWATEVAAGRGVEGQVMTSLTGCTFKVYSTIQGALTAQDGSGEANVIFVCSGTYTENLTIPTSASTESLRIIGAGMESTKLVPATTAGPILTTGSQSALMYEISHFTFDMSGMDADAKGISSGASATLMIHHCLFAMDGTIGIDITVNPTAISVDSCYFLGSGTGIDSTGGTVVGKLLVDHCQFLSTVTIGVQFGTTGALSSVTNCKFNALTGILITTTDAGKITVTGNEFADCGVFGVGCSGLGFGGNENNITVVGNDFFNCTVGADFSGVSTFLQGLAINDNGFYGTSTDIGVKFHATRNQNSTVIGNTFTNYTAGNEFSGQTLAEALTAGNQICHNETNSGTPLLDSGRGHATGTSGGFAAPSPHNLVSTHHDGEQDYTSALYLGELRLGVNGTTGDLYWYSDAGTTQKGMIDGATGHMTIGSSAVADLNTGIGIFSSSITPTGAFSALSAVPTISLTGANSATVASFRSSLSISASSAQNQTGILSGTHANIVGGANVTISDLRNFYATFAQSSASSAVTDRYGLYVANPTGNASATVTNQYGVYIENMTKGGTINRAIQSLGGISTHLGSMHFGSNSAPTNGTASNGIVTAGGFVSPDAALVHSAANQLAGPLVIPLQGAIRFSDSDNSHYTGFKAHATTTASVEYTWPAADGTSGYQLTTDGAGVLSWAAAGSGGGGGHTIQDDNSSMTARTNLSFQDGFVLTDDAGGDQTEIDLSYAGTGDLANVAATEATGSAITVPRGDHVHALGIGTTRGDLIIFDSTPKAARLAVGSAHQVLKSDGTDPAWGRPFVWMQIARWYIDGRLRADTSNAQGPVIRLPDFATACTLVEGSSIHAALGTTSAGASVIIDIKHSSTYEGSRTSIFDGTNYPTIAAGDTFTGDGSSNDGTIDTTPTDYTALDGGFLWLYVRQVGSTSGSEGTDLTVDIIAKVYTEFA